MLVNYNQSMQEAGHNPLLSELAKLKPKQAETGPETAVQRAAEALYDAYVTEITGRKTNTAASAPYRADFITKAQEQIETTEPDTIERRLMQTNVAAIYYLIFSGHLAKEVRVRKVAEGQQIEFEEKVIQIFLEKLRNKNKEEEAYDLGVTLGMEVEFRGIIDQIQKIMDERRLSPTLKTRYKDYIGQTPLSSSDSGLWFHQLFPRLSKANPVLVDQVSLGTFKPRVEYTGQEVVTNVSASPNTFLRELLWAHKLGALPNASWNIHLNVGGVDLTTGDFRFMDILLMASAANFFPKRDFSQIRLKQIAKGDAPATALTEKFYKEWREGRVIVLAPHFKKRDSELKVEKYGNSLPGEPNVVEIRSIPSYNAQEFVKLVRFTTFTYYYSLGLKATQREEQERTPLEKELVKIFLEFREQWKALLVDQDITPLDKTEDYMVASQYREQIYQGTDNIAKLPFLKQESLLNYKRQIDKDFGKSVRLLIARYQGDVKRAVKKHSPKAEET